LWYHIGAVLGYVWVKAMVAARTEWPWLAAKRFDNEREYLRDLARQVRDIAALPVMQERSDLWRAHNALAPKRPMVLCYPEGSWVEILPEAALRCTDPLHRRIESDLLGRIFLHEHIQDDQPFSATLSIDWKVDRGSYGVEVPYHHGDERGSYVWEAPLKNLDADLAKLKFRQPRVDRKATMDDFARAVDLVGDILTVRLSGNWGWTYGLTWEAVKLVGLEQLMWYMVDDPAGLHRLMKFLHDDMQQYLDWWEREKLLTPNDIGGSYVGSGGLGAVDALRGKDALDTPVDLAHRWGFAESQETVGVGPDMFAEFILPYQAPLLARFGLNCYGCCEGLEHRIDLLLKNMPNLRRVSVAPNANQEKMAEALNGKYVYSRKVYPAHVCVGFNEAAIRGDLRHSLRVAKGQPLELILKDTHTVEGDVMRLGRWVKIAREEIAAL